MFSRGGATRTGRRGLPIEGRVVLCYRGSGSRLAVSESPQKGALYSSLGNDPSPLPFSGLLRTR